MNLVSTIVRHKVGEKRGDDRGIIMLSGGELEGRGSSYNYMGVILWSSSNVNYKWVLKNAVTKEHQASNYF